MALAQPGSSLFTMDFTLSPCQQNGRTRGRDLAIAPDACHTVIDPVVNIQEPFSISRTSQLLISSNGSIALLTQGLPNRVQLRLLKACVLTPRTTRSMKVAILTSRYAYVCACKPVANVVPVSNLSILCRRLTSNTHTSMRIALVQSPSFSIPAWARHSRGKFLTIERADFLNCQSMAQLHVLAWLSKTFGP